jgi:hypothetical protein
MSPSPSSSPFRSLGLTTAAPLAVVWLLSVSACSSSPVGPDGVTGDTAPDHAAPDLPPVRDGGFDAATDVGPDAPDAPPPDLGPLSADCDPLDPEVCSLPWPSNLYLQPDTSTATGFRLQFGPTTLPANRAGVHVDPAAYTHLDGYAVSTPIMVQLSNLDPATNLPSENQIDASMTPGSPVGLFEADAQGNLTRLPCFAEFDSYEGVPEKKVMFIRPAVILKEATRYVVALTGLNDALGAPLPAGPAFAALRDGTMTGNEALDAQLAPRRPRFQEIITMLGTAGVPTGADLFLAWDFVTASNQALHGRLLSMRDDAITTVGAQGPPLTVTSVVEFVPADDGSGRQVDADIGLEVQGTFHVPSYLRPHPDSTGNELNLDANGVPQQNGTRDPTFLARIPYSALNGGPAHGLVEYGHGLLGSADEVRNDFIGTICNQNNLIYFAADLTGMNSANASAVLASLMDVSQFVTVADPLHQGILEWVLLARAMRAQLAGLPELAMYNITTNPDELFYSGISQGGIFGGTLVAVSPDIDRGHLGVPGSNYSLLLGRSHDFAGYFSLLKTSYPSSADRAVLLAALQLLWESTDPVSHYRHMTVDPYPGNQPKSVLLAPAKGDYQVAVISNEILARSQLGISLMANYDNQRMPFGIDQANYPLTGSGIVLYDFGNAWPPPGNVVPDDPAGDPHEKPRRAAWHNMQLVNFLRTGQIIDVCGGDGCHPQ